jgi:hypothetical protein
MVGVFRKFIMKEIFTPAAITVDESNGELELPCSDVQAWHLAFNGSPRLYENFPRFQNGPDRCQLRKLFEKKKRRDPS